MRPQLHPDRWAIPYARIALATAFLSSVAARFGLWGRGWSGFGDFVAYTAEVNAFLPAFTIPAIAWAATIAETVLGVALLAGWWLRGTALASGVLLGLFALAMAISLGVKEPLDYSVFSASAAAFLLARHYAPPEERR